MATEIAHTPVAQALPQGTSVLEAADVISGIINPSAEKPAEAPIETPAEQEPPRKRRAKLQAVEEPMETPDEAPQDDEEAQEAPDTDVDEPSPNEAAETDEQSVDDGDVEEIEIEPAQLAELLGIEEKDLIIDDDGKLAFSTKADGGTQAVQLRNLRDSYELRERAEQRLTKLGEERKTFEAERTSQLQQLQQQTEQMAQAIGTIEREYAAEWEGVNWQQLRAEDPQEFALKRADFDDRLRRLNAYKAQYQDQLSKAQEAWQDQQKTLISEGHRKLEEAMTAPELAKAGAWDDAAKNAVYQHMVEAGIPNEVLNATPYWQAFVWARKAMLYDKMTSEAKKTVKRVARLPKIAKPGAKKGKTQIKRTNREAARRRQIKAGGSIQSTAERLSEIIRSS